MKIGMTGLGRMGLGMRARIQERSAALVEQGVIDAPVEVVGFDVNPEVRDVESLAELVASLEAPRVIWMMLPLEPIVTTLDELAGLLEPGDVIVDGGNSDWRVSAERAERFAELGVDYVDCGTSGGIWGRERGYALMVGGTDRAVELLDPVWKSLKPEVDGFVHAGTSGAGHATKAYHNLGEYIMMGALGEVYSLLEAHPSIKDPAEIFASWRNGSIVGSFLLDLAVTALEADKDLSSLAPVVQDSGEGRWSVRDSIDFTVPLPLGAASLYDRFSSRGGSDSARRLEAALRNAFGGHAVTAATQEPGKDLAGDSPASDPTPQG